MQTKWPTETAGLYAASLAPKLQRWIPSGQELRAFVYTRDHACLPILLARNDDERDRQPADSPGALDAEPAPPGLSGAIIQSQGVSGGTPRRLCQGVWLGETFEADVNTYFQDQQADGSWRDSPGLSAIGDPPINYGAPVHVDDDVVRFGGEIVTAGAECAGPEEWLPCRTGGERPCDLCQNVELWFHNVFAVGERLRLNSIPPERRPTCSEPCPPRSNPDLERIRSQGPMVRFWRWGDVPAAERPGLYRELSDCRNEHPP